MYKGIRILYVIDAWLFPAAILVQVFFADLSLFTHQNYWGAHDPFCDLPKVLAASDTIWVKRA
ncbi:hypothetical protein [Ktedonobacter robiniae]|uniref:Uncharacterized protein n=1 Tax=Ktedonobacter robiniae TaxID=2778365 RepID=A0ABQ3UXN6_9CHLR|nr:hypothetical protein [Ktedonobacter robiniae]GHO57634.1 hypothetical protein KSB_61090 [Ktedonobacter robiniae]